MTPVAKETASGIAEQIVAAHGRDQMAAIRTLLERNAALAEDVERCLEAVSEGYVRGRPKR